jgi:hypothetical protein
MHLSRTLTLAALVAALGTLSARADEPGADVIVKRSHARRHVVVKSVSVRRAERDGAVLFSGKVMSRDYAYPRYSPGLLPTGVAVAYGYA